MPWYSGFDIVSPLSPAAMVGAGLLAARERWARKMREKKAQQEK